MLLEMGVPVAKITPWLLVSSSRYWHLAKRSEDFCASVCAMPPTFRIFVIRNRFLKLWLSSMNSRSMPNSSKVTVSSLVLWSLSFSNRVSSDLRVRSICLMVKFSALCRLASLMASSTSLICRCRISRCRSRDRGIFIS